MAATATKGCRPNGELLIGLVLLLAPILPPISGAVAERARETEATEELTGTIYASPERQKVLYTFRRTATSTGTMTRVMRAYNYPDGQPAARERVFYKQGSLRAYELQQLQIGAWGRAIVESDPKTGKERLHFTYVHGRGSEAEREVDTEPFTAETVLNDSLVPYMKAHWETLMAGERVEFRYIVIPRTETVGFELVKAEETSWRGRPMVRIKMAPANFFIALLVDPIYFTVEKGGDHRVLQYTGRTTPKIKHQGEWEDLRAVTVFDSRSE